MNARRLIGALVCVVALAGCMARPVRPEIPHLAEDLASKSSSPDEVRLVVYNGSNKLLFGMDYTGRVNIWLDGKALGGPDIGEYLQVQVPRGKHQFKLVHLDLVEIKSVHEVDLQDDPTFMEVYATPVSNAFKLHPELPTGNALPKPFTRMVTK